MLRVSVPDPAPGWDALRASSASPRSSRQDVLREAEQARAEPGGEDALALPLLTVDPPGSVDLDQAMALSRAGRGYRIHYAIADVASFVRPGGPVDCEAHRRGATLYAPDRRIPLHRRCCRRTGPACSPARSGPRSCGPWTSTGRASWLDAGRRATVRSRQQLDYTPRCEGVPEVALLEEIGELRLAAGRRRGAVDLPTPEQEVDAEGRLTFRAQRPSERWNAQISLLTGMAAARLMLDGGIGLLRTLPTPPRDAVDSLRRSAQALGVPWPTTTGYGELLSRLDPGSPGPAALLTLATRLLRGAGYTAFDGAAPEVAVHSAVAAPYAHCTAPLRRLADRYVPEVCLALCAGTPVPAWVREALPRLPEEMAESDRRAHALDRAVVDLAEATVLQQRVGESFDAVVVESSPQGGHCSSPSRPSVGRLEGADPPLGKRVRVRLVRG